MVVVRFSVAVLALSIGVYSGAAASTIATTVGISADAALPIAVYGATFTYRRLQLSAEVISSLGLRYGPAALQTAIAVKLSRTLWIVPLTLAIALGVRRRQPAGTDLTQPGKKFKVAAPWFIGFFLLASLLNSYVPAVAVWSPPLSKIAGRGMILVLFLIGSSLSLRTLRVVGWRTVVTGLALWLFIGTASLAAIRLLHLSP